MYTYICIYIYTYKHTNIYMYIYDTSEYITVFLSKKAGANIHQIHIYRCPRTIYKYIHIYTHVAWPEGEQGMPADVGAKIHEVLVYTCPRTICLYVCICMSPVCPSERASKECQPMLAPISTNSESDGRSSMIAPV